MINLALISSFSVKHSGGGNIRLRVDGHATISKNRVSKTRRNTVIREDKTRDAKGCADFLRVISPPPVYPILRSLFRKSFCNGSRYE